jgi:hypothetical protein
MVVGRGIKRNPDRNQLVVVNETILLWRVLRVIHIGGVGSRITEYHSSDAPPITTPSPARCRARVPATDVVRARGSARGPGPDGYPPSRARQVRPASPHNSRKCKASTSSERISTANGATTSRHQSRQSKQLIPDKPLGSKLSSLLDRPGPTLVAIVKTF